MVLAARKPHVDSGGPTRGHEDPAESRFYAKYAWCLNPLLTFEEQLTNLLDGLESASRLTLGWQREESTINAYLLTCGIACTVDDYLGRRAWDLTSVSGRFPGLRLAAAILRWVLNRPHHVVTRISDHPVRRWRARWTHCVDLACDMLAAGAMPEEHSWSELRSTCVELSQVPLPSRLRRRRLRVPEGFRRQDLSHHDVLALARRFAERHPQGGSGLGVIGVRTAGAYFAPLATAYFAALGWNPAAWFTIRPRDGLSGPERRHLRKLARTGAPVLVVDDHPNTGRTLTLALAALERCGIRPERITILTPRHPVRPDWKLPGEAPGADRVEVVTLEPEETYKAQLLTPAAVAPLLTHWFGRRGWQRVGIRPNPQVDALNGRLAEHCRDGFQVRLKRVFDVELRKDGEDPVVVRVIAKSVGWGWLGYHAYLAGTRLAGLVPPVVGLRHGLLFAEWVGELAAPSARPSTGTGLARLAAYVARRAQRLRLSDDPGSPSDEPRWDGWRVLLDALRRAYGPYVGRLKASALRQQLRRFATPRPMLVDGRMRPEEWLETPHAIYKLDYEHHNFGPGELDVVDAAYDLASAVFEFGLDEQAEGELVQAYARETADGFVAERVLLYKLLSGTVAMQQAAGRAPHASWAHGRAWWNERYLAARNFLAHQLHRVCAQRGSPWPPPTWAGPLFFLDVDGVLDCERLGFPHTTVSGVAALALLRAHGFAVVLNTGRSVEQVRQYCQIYGLPGGVAEYGSVFVDAVRGRDVTLTSPVALEQLAQCRDALRSLPGVFLDPAYRCAVRSYRYEDGRMVGLPSSRLQEVLSQPQFTGLASITTSADAYVVEQGITKGTALRAVKRYLDRPDAPVVAMGDSDQDVPMLELADSWYAPANCSLRVRALARVRPGHITRRPTQRGFLEAARDLLRRQGVRPDTTPSLCSPLEIRTPADLLLTLLHVAERPRAVQILAALTLRRL